jgi:hypothetical protein
MLLIDGKKYELNDDELREHGVRRVWHVEPKPYDRVNDKHGISEGVGFPNTYIKRSGQNFGKETRVTYYTHEEHDETRKRTNYYVDNTGSTIIIGNKGILRTQNAELNYFLFYSPHNGSNPARADVLNNPYPDKKVYFFMYNPSVSNKSSADRLKAKTDLWKVISLESDKRWSDNEIILACKTINASADRPIPTVLTEYTEYMEEEGVPALRNGLADLADREPLWLKSTMITNRRSMLSRLVHQCLDNKELTGFAFNTSERKYTITNEKGKEDIFLEVPDKKDSDKYLLDTLFTNHKMTEKLYKLLEKVSAE